MKDKSAAKDAYSGWFAWCEYGCHWALRVFWWDGGDAACKRCRRRNGSWRYIKAVLDAEA